jgi:hypothetical protein
MVVSGDTIDTICHFNQVDNAVNVHIRWGGGSACTFHFVRSTAHHQVEQQQGSLFVLSVGDVDVFLLLSSLLVYAQPHGRKEYQSQHQIVT